MRVLTDRLSSVLCTTTAQMSLFGYVSKHSLRFYHMTLVRTPPCHALLYSVYTDAFGLTAWLPFLSGVSCSLIPFCFILPLCTLSSFLFFSITFSPLYWGLIFDIYYIVFAPSTALCAL